MSLDPPQPTRRNKYIHDSLSDAIRQGKLPSGLVLTQSSVGRHFGVSRAPAADALQRMLAEGLVSRFDGRGLIVGPAGNNPLRIELSKMSLDDQLADDAMLGARNWRDTLYPTVEVEVASCIRYGTFVLGSAALANHYGFSRTTSHEMLSRLERVGLTQQVANGRWHARVMTATDAHDNYQIRRLLEPVALLDAACAPGGVQKVKAALDRIDRLKTGSRRMNRDDVTATEVDLNIDLILSCSNPRMRDALYRSQLPVIAINTAFNRYVDVHEMLHVLTDHEAILRPLAAGDTGAATAALADHLEQGLRSTLAYLETKPTPPPGLIPP